MGAVHGVPSRRRHAVQRHLQAPDVTTGRRGLSQGQALAEMRDNYKIAEKETGVAMDFSDVPTSCVSPTSTGG
jgi:hypothetical protein